jgi:hypothetical protein
MHRVCAYLRELEAALPGISEGSALASVLDHCMYCGMSLGRVGLDFRGLLPELFQACMFNLVTKGIPTKAAFGWVSFRLPSYLLNQPLY